MDPRVASEVSIADLFDQFIEASTMRNVLSIHMRILNYSDLNPCEFNEFFPKLKRAVMTNRARKNWKAKALFSKIDKKAAHRCYSNTKAPTPLGARLGDTNQDSSYIGSQECIDGSISSQSNRTYCNNNALQHYNCLVIGSGPAGLRTAIELQLLGASKVVVVEKRGRFSRNNVLHLWPFVIDDLKSLGAKKFYGKFCAGSIDHISIRQLQLILLKICLMIGCDFRDSCGYLYLCPESIKRTQQAANGNNGDSKNANVIGDYTEIRTLKCDFDVNDLSYLDKYVKVSSNPTDGQDNGVKELNSEEINLHSQELKEVTLATNVQEICGDNDSHREDIELEESNNVRPSTPKLIKPADKEVRRGENLRGARAHFKSETIQERELHSYEWDIIIGADGRRNTLSRFFPRKEFRGKLAIAITANFINRQTPAEASVSEISGLSFIYNQDMFNALAYDTNIQLENICYYKDDTHYFVMTAKKKSLLMRGVLIKDHAITQDLLSDDNVDKQALLKYAKDAAYWTTGLEPLDFALNHYGQEDCAMFDFTSMYAASNSCKALRTKEGGLTLVSLVGDSLLEPFWPTGSGCARGFLSSFDAAWMCRQWAVNKCAVIDFRNTISSRSSRNRSSMPAEGVRGMEPTTYNKMALSVIAERESIYRILAQTKSENLQQNYSHWTLNPHTRYPNLNRHLVTPSQVEHLITDNEVMGLSADKSKLMVANSGSRSRRIKSPMNGTPRKSPKKLKSANASPLMQPKNSLGKPRPSSRQKSKSGCDLALDDTCLEFEESYNNLTDGDKGPAQYLNHRRANCDLLDDLFVPSISGTIPSSNNLHSLEARRARDIDECLRQRRQKTQISAVRDKLIGQFRGEEANRRRGSSGSPIVPGNAALFNELRRMREQQAKGKENKMLDANGPLSLFNSMRRCASFAERVKSFESKLGHPNGQDSQVSSPKTPIENVKDLPQFATLQELFVNNSTLNNEQTKKSKLPIMKLNKDDWNVSCWEKRLAAYKQKNSMKELSGSTKSLNKAISVDSYHAYMAKKPERQVEVFKDRIKEMAEKLQKTRDNNQKLYGGESMKDKDFGYDLKSNGRAKGWVSHVRQELIKGVEAKRPQDIYKNRMNPAIPNKPIKKLFEDDEDEVDGLDIDKHYDHLCINRPTNKYLPKNGYTSHLTRTKYNSATSRVINRQPSASSKQAYLTALTSRGSSASSTMSDYSGGSSSGGGGNGTGRQQVVSIIKCFRCKESVCTADKISIGDSILHRSCLTCANCGITLRTSEIQHYLYLLRDPSNGEDCSFVCAICKPNIRAYLNREAADRLAQANEVAEIESYSKQRLQSREDFLNQRINYNELYKNILDNNMSTQNDATQKIERLQSRGQTPTSAEDVDTKLATLDVEEDQKSAIAPSPVNVTLPLALIIGGDNRRSSAESSESDTNSGYRIARSEIIDGSEQVTLVLPAEPLNESVDYPRDCDQESSASEMIDEDELHRILHLNTSTCSASGSKKDGGKSSNEGDSSDHVDSSDDEEGAKDGDEAEDKHNEAAAELSDDPSSLNSPPNSEEYDDIDDNVDQNSTYEDFLTSEEFGTASDRDEDGLTEEDSQDVDEPATVKLPKIDLTGDPPIEAE